MTRYAASEEHTWCSVVINLARRADRRLRLAHVLAPENGELLGRLTRLDAVDGRGIDLADEQRLLPFISAEALEIAKEAQRIGAHTIVHKDGELVKFHDHFTTGGIACTMSHHAALEAVASHPTAEWGLILEDDIQSVRPNVHSEIAGILQRLPQDWDALFVGYHGGVLAGTGPGGKDTEQEVSKCRLELQIDEMRGMGDGFKGSVTEEETEPAGAVPVLRMYGPLYGLYAWVVRKEAARAMIDGGFPVGGQVDHALSLWLVQERGRCFKVAPQHLLFYSPKSEDGLDSDIQTMAKLDDLLADPEQCERYMAFIKENGSAETS